MSASRLAAVHEQIATAALQAGRSLSDIELIAVSKTFSIEEITPILEAGQRRFGENRVQEAKGKWPSLKAIYRDVELHLIGPLQTNKAADAVDLFDVIHTVDRPRLASALSELCARLGKSPRLFVQVNIGAEPQKAGIPIAETAEFVRDCRQRLKLDIRGLMCIPPVDQDPRMHFQHLARMARDLRLPALSMGMSNDFAIAIQEGATHIRVGSAIFGSR